MKGKAQSRVLQGTGTRIARHIQRMPSALVTCLAVERIGSRNQPLYLILCPRRRSNVSSTISISGSPAGINTRMIKASNNLLSTQGDQRSRFSTRWYLIKCLSSASPIARRAAATVRRPGARIVPYNKTNAFAKVGVVNAVAKNETSCIISGDGLGMNPSCGVEVWLLLHYHRRLIPAHLTY